MGRRKTPRRQPSQAARDFCVSERQWSRKLRIDNARLELSLAGSDSHRQFWRDVLTINGAKA